MMNRSDSAESGNYNYAIEIEIEITDSSDSNTIYSDSDVVYSEESTIYIETPANTIDLEETIDCNKQSTTDEDKGCISPLCEKMIAIYWLILIISSIASLIIGIIVQDNCSVEPAIKINVWLIVYGCTGILSAILPLTTVYIMEYPPYEWVSILIIINLGLSIAFPMFLCIWEGMGAFVILDSMSECIANSSPLVIMMIIDTSHPTLIILYILLYCFYCAFIKDILFN